MTLPKYTASQRREIVAKVGGIGEQYLYQILTRVKVATPLLARKLNSVDPNLKLKDLRPDDWKVLWPELQKSSQKTKKRKVIV